jgi:hypothetical protein
VQRWAQLSPVFCVGWVLFLGSLLTHCKPTHATKGHQASGATVNILAQCSHANKGKKRSKQPWKRLAVAPCQIQQSGLRLLIQWPLVSLQGPSLSLWSPPCFSPMQLFAWCPAVPSLRPSCRCSSGLAALPHPCRSSYPPTSLTQPHPASPSLTQYVP